ncbi:unnamed protein product [Trichogramma brassicae]|uniref:Uncharacterized protein n=1 Tax=Trichogramma brassicae TaxID=86971 RepID=A0A6H5IZP6_9HYME|nr:unnamed protein product [Trichogramma brassicae]
MFAALKKHAYFFTVSTKYKRRSITKSFKRQTFVSLYAYARYTTRTSTAAAHLAYNTILYVLRARDISHSTPSRPAALAEDDTRVIIRVWSTYVGAVTALIELRTRASQQAKLFVSQIFFHSTSRWLVNSACGQKRLIQFTRSLAELPVLLLLLLLLLPRLCAKRVLIFVAFFATTIFAETPVARQRYFVAQPSSGQSAPYAPRGWKPDGPSFDLPGRQNQPSVNVRYPQNIGSVDQQQRQQPSSQFGPFEIEIDLAPAIPADSPRVNLQPQVQSQYREPSRVYGAPSQQFPDPRETYGPPVQRPNINFDNQYEVPAQGRFNVPNNQQFAPVPQQELTPPSLSNPNVFNPARAQQPSKLSNPTNLYDAPKQSQYIPPNFDNQYDVPVNQFDSPNKQSPYQSSATNVQEFNTPTQQPFGVNNANENEYRAPAKQQFGVGPNIQDQFNEPGQDEFGVQHPQTSNREPNRKKQILRMNSAMRLKTPKNPASRLGSRSLNEANTMYLFPMDACSESSESELDEFEKVSHHESAYDSSVESTDGSSENASEHSGFNSHFEVEYYEQGIRRLERSFSTDEIASSTDVDDSVKTVENNLSTIEPVILNSNEILLDLLEVPELIVCPESTNSFVPLAAARRELESNDEVRASPPSKRRMIERETDTVKYVTREEFDRGIDQLDSNMKKHVNKIKASMQADFREFTKSLMNSSAPPKLNLPPMPMKNLEDFLAFEASLRENEERTKSMGYWNSTSNYPSLRYVPMYLHGFQEQAIERAEELSELRKRPIQKIDYCFSFSFAICSQLFICHGLRAMMFSQMSAARVSPAVYTASDALPRIHGVYVYISTGPRCGAGRRLRRRRPAAATVATAAVSLLGLQAQGNLSSNRRSGLWDKIHQSFAADRYWRASADKTPCKQLFYNETNTQTHTRDTSRPWDVYEDIDEHTGKSLRNEPVIESVVAYSDDICAPSLHLQLFSILQPWGVKNVTYNEARHDRVYIIIIYTRIQARVYRP